MSFLFYSFRLLLVLIGGALVLVLTLLFGWLRSRGQITLFFPEYRRSAVKRKLSFKGVLLSLLLLCGYFSLAIAVFEPAWGEKKQERLYYGSDVMFCLDISNSMLARDIAPARLEAAKIVMRNVMADDNESNFGITIFKGDASVIVPLTKDKTAINTIIEGINPGYSTVPGTNVAEGLVTAAAGFPQDRPGKGYIFLLSDGEGLEGDPLQQKVLQACKGIEVWTFLLGSKSGGLITVQGDKNIQTIADPALLRSIAEAADGSFFNISDSNWWEEFKKEFDAKISAFGESRAGADYEFIPNRRYRFVILLAVSFFLLYVVIRSLLWKKTL